MFLFHHFELAGQLSFFSVERCTFDRRRIAHLILWTSVNPSPHLLALCLAYLALFFSAENLSVCVVRFELLISDTERFL